MAKNKMVITRDFEKKFDRSVIDRLEILAATGVLGHAPAGFIKTYLKTGVIDGTLWPIKLPVLLQGR